MALPQLGNETMTSKQENDGEDKSPQEHRFRTIVKVFRGLNGLLNTLAVSSVLGTCIIQDWRFGGPSLAVTIMAAIVFFSGFCGIVATNSKKWYVAYIVLFTCSIFVNIATACVMMVWKNNVIHQLMNHGDSHGDAEQVIALGRATIYIILCIQIVTIPVASYVIWDEISSYRDVIDARERLRKYWEIHSIHNHDSRVVVQLPNEINCARPVVAVDAEELNNIEAYKNQDDCTHVENEQQSEVILADENVLRFPYSIDGWKANFGSYISPSRSSIKRSPMSSPSRSSFKKSPMSGYAASSRSLSLDMYMLGTSSLGTSTSSLGGNCSSTSSDSEGSDLVAILRDNLPDPSFFSYRGTYTSSSEDLANKDTTLYKR